MNIPIEKIPCAENKPWTLKHSVTHVFNIEKSLSKITAFGLVKKGFAQLLKLF